MPHAPLISDDELLALVEQRPIAPERQTALRQALANDPALVRSIRSMRADMLAMHSLAEGTDALAPADMLASVEARLEREALLGLATLREPDDIAAPIPISTLQPRGRSFADFTLRSSWLPRLAVAAAIALVGGAAYFAIAPLLNRPTGSHQLATRNSTADIAPPADQRPIPPEALANRTTPRPALDPALDPVPAIDAPDAFASLITGPDPIASLISPGTLSNPAAPRIAEISLAHALAAAQDGRLILRLHTARPLAPAAPDTITRRLATLSARAPLSPLSPRLSAMNSTSADGVLAMVNAHHAAIASGASRPSAFPALRPSPDTPNVASPRSPSASPSNPSLTSPAMAPTPPTPATTAIPTPSFDPFNIYSASILPTELSLQQLKRLLTTADTEATFDIIPPGTPQPPALASPGAPESATIFWWNQPPRTWTPRLAVPVITQLTN